MKLVLPSVVLITNSGKPMLESQGDEQEMILDRITKIRGPTLPVCRGVAAAVLFTAPTAASDDGKWFAVAGAQALGAQQMLFLHALTAAAGAVEFVRTEILQRYATVELFSAHDCFPMLLVSTPLVLS